jgi:hypothetical protein
MQRVRAIDRPRSRGRSAANPLANASRDLCLDLYNRLDHLQLEIAEPGTIGPPALRCLAGAAPGPASTRLGLLGFPPAIFTNYWMQDSHLCASQRSVRLSSGLHAGPWASRVQWLFRHRNTQVLCAMHSPSSVSRTTDGGSART